MFFLPVSSLQSSRSTPDSVPSSGGCFRLFDLAAVRVTSSGSVTGSVFAAARTAARDSGVMRFTTNLCLRILLETERNDFLHLSAAPPMKTCVGAGRSVNASGAFPAMILHL